MIRIGIINIDTSHPITFAEYLKKGKRARYTAIYNDGFRSEAEVEGFISKYGLERRCSSIEELADCVDIGFVQGCNWDRHLSQAKLFLAGGKPVFIDKPIVGSLSDCLKLEELVAGGAVVLGSSSVRYANEITEFMSIPEEERGKVLNIYGTAGVDEFNYAIHIVEAIDALAGADALSTRFIGRGRLDGKVCETFFVTFDNGITAAYNTCHGLWQPFEVVVMTTKTVHQFGIDNKKLYGALLDRICDYMETGANRLAPVSRLTHAVKIMLAGRLSRENGGREVLLRNISENDPGFDGDKFEREYAAAAQT
ncbi:MAG: Gfo/Idh/MocA family oxidoreductase [bacterium]|jgi:hypothetical protein|nr:hypothetical protein [bacterium]